MSFPKGLTNIQNFQKTLISGNFSKAQEAWEAVKSKVICPSARKMIEETIESRLLEKKELDDHMEERLELVNEQLF